MSSAQTPDADREDYVVSVVEFAGDPGAATAALQRVFGLSEEDARTILQKMPVAVRRGVNRIRAEYFRRGLELSGARVEVRDGDGAVVTAESAPATRAQMSGPIRAPAQPSPSAAARPRPASQPLAAADPNGLWLRGGAPAAPIANDTAPASRESSGGWGDLQPFKNAANPKSEAKPAAAKPAEQPWALNLEGEEPVASPPAKGTGTLIQGSNDFGPLDSPLAMGAGAGGQSQDLLQLETPAGRPPASRGQTQDFRPAPAARTPAARGQTHDLQAPPPARAFAARGQTQDFRPAAAATAPAARGQTQNLQPSPAARAPVTRGQTQDLQPSPAAAKAPAARGQTQDLRPSPAATGPGGRAGAATLVISPFDAPSAKDAGRVVQGEQDLGPLDSPFASVAGDHALELASMRAVPRSSVEEPHAMEFDAGPGAGVELELDVDPALALGRRPASQPRFEAISAGEHRRAPGSDTLAKARRRQVAQESDSLGSGRPSPAPGGAPARGARAASVDLRGAAAATNARHSAENPQGPAATRARPASGDLDPLAAARASASERRAPARPASGDLAPRPERPASGDLRDGRVSHADPGSQSAGDGMSDTGRRAGRRSAPQRASGGRPAIRSHGPLDFSFLEAVQLALSGTAAAWLGVIAAAAFVLAAVAALSLRLPALGLPLVLVAFTGFLALCGGYHRHAFWAAATREELTDKPALSASLLMREGLHFAGFALITQVLLWAWISGQFRSGQSALAIVCSPTLWVLGFGPGFYWPIALGCAAARNRARDIWNVALGLRVLGRAPGNVATVVLATAAVFSGTLVLATALLNAMSLNPTFALIAASGFPIAISHGLAATLLGRVAHARPDLFD